MRKKRIVLSVLIAVAVIVGSALLFFILTKRPSSTASGDLNIAVPAGWYVHDTNGMSVLLTRQQQLPMAIKGTEGFAYGEQIRVEKVTMNAPWKDWVMARIPDNDSLYGEKEFGNIDGVTTLKVEHQVAAAGGELNYYVFSGDQAYVFSLYPVVSYDETTLTMGRNATGLQALDQVVHTFVAGLPR